MKAALILAAVLTAVALATAHAAPGSTWVFWLFNGAMISMVSLALVGPFSYVYGFLAGFLFLGFWNKLTIHLWLGTAFIEPTGFFDDSAAVWDLALLAAAVVAFALIAARGTQLLLLKRTAAPANTAYRIPALYVRHAKAIWIVTILLTLALNFWNSKAAFYQIGVNPRLILPAHLNVIMAWLFNWGLAFWIACLVFWEVKTRPHNSYAVILGSIFEAVVGSLSTLSRSVYLFHALAGILVWLKPDNKLSLGRKAIWGVVPFLIGFVATLYLVQVQRSALYFLDFPDSDISENYKTMSSEKLAKERKATEELYRRGMLMQIPFLFFNRWVGLEAMLAVSAYPEKENKLLLDALHEDPKLGVDSIYQKISRSGYTHSERFTFLTLAGAPAIFFYSGSLGVVFGGMFLFVALLLLIEFFAWRWTGNPYVVSLAGVSMAYTTTQINFPYLAIIFFIQLIFTLALIAVLQRFGSEKPQKASNE